MIFNNIRNRNHPQLFGEGAFFDLDSDKYQGDLIEKIENNGTLITFRQGSQLSQGDQCIVFSYHPEDGQMSALDRRIVMKTFSFEQLKIKNEVLKNGSIRNQRVFYGQKIEPLNLELNRIQAVEAYPYCFNVLNNFNQFNVKDNEVHIG